MGWKPVVIIAAIGIAVGLIVLSGEKASDEATVRELERSRREQESASVPLESTRPEFHPTFWQLTDRLKASKNGARETWFIRSDDSDSLIQLPFPPAADGAIASHFPPAADASGGDHAASQNPGYVGAEGCAECHREKYESFIQTAHHHASGPAELDFVHGHFSEPNNLLKTSDPALAFSVQKSDRGLLQTVSFFDWKADIPMDIVTGSAKTGQTYLYWLDDALFQAHVSYMNELDEWVPSPGFDRTPVDYTRPIKTVCLECHITYIDVKRPPNFYERDSAILGISCERCHGPGREHIDFHRANPNQTIASHIVYPAKLTRERQLDICAQCHSGDFRILGKPFGYRPGDDLRLHHQSLNPESDGIGGIHTSNQLLRLQKSQCFIQSEMTCTTCHNPHKNQRDDTVMFSASCIQCHQPEHCGMQPQLGTRILEDCVSCHMPESKNNEIRLEGSRGSFVMPMVDHYIRVDQASTKRFVEREREE